jgi:hypothetical protein
MVLPGAPAQDVLGILQKSFSLYVAFWSSQNTFEALWD